MPQALSDASEESTKKFQDVGIRVASIHYPLAMFGMLYTSHKTMREDGRDFSRKLLKMGERLGTSVLVVHPHNKVQAGYEELLEKPIIDNLLWLADLSEKHGITMVVENSPKTCATAEQLNSYVEMLNHPNIKLMVDTTEVCEAGGDPVEFLKKVSPSHLHLSDFSEKSKHLPIGDGKIDWKGVKDALGDYSGFYTLEPTYRYYLDNIESRLRKAYSFMCSWLGE